MNDDVFELVDREYGECQQVKYPKQIKTRQSSFQAILGRFRSFRIKLLERKLDKMKDKALGALYTERNYDSKISKKSEAIARLEEKIKVLSREDVPTNYVDNRAIKLKQSMIDNLQHKIGMIYSIDSDKKEEIFASEVQEPVIPEMVATAATKDDGKVDLDVDTIDRQTITDTINEGFKNEEEKDEPTINRDDVQSVVEEEVVKIDDSDTIDRDAIEQTINEEFAKKEQEAEEEVVVEERAESQNGDLTSEEIKSVIEEELGKLEQSIPEMDTVAKEEASDEVVPIAEEVVEKDEHVRVSRNNTNNAKLSRYDENGQDIKEYEFEQAVVEEPKLESIVEIEPDQEERPRRKKYHYVPMTDEEIREAQIKLGFDEHGNLIDKKEPTEEEVVANAEPVVVEKSDLSTIPEYYITESIKPVEKPDTSVIDDQVVVESVKSNKATIDNYAALKEKILHLREQQAQTKKQKEEAERRAEEAKQKAREIREMVAESERSVAESIDMLRAYSEALEEDCDRNIKSAEASESSAEADYKFVSSNQEKLDSNAELIREIDSLIGPRVDPKSIRVK